MSASNWTSAALVAAGVLFFFVGSVGLLRLPDVFTRLHALTKVDNLGLGLTVAGLAIESGEATTALRLLLTWVLVLGASSVVAFLIAGAASRANQQRQ